MTLSHIVIDNGTVLVAISVGPANLGLTLGQLDRSEEALVAYRELLDRYGEDPALRSSPPQRSITWA